MNGETAGPIPRTVRIVSVAGLFFALSLLGTLGDPDREISPLGLAAGFALAAVLVLGPRVWPGIALGSLAFNAWIGLPWWLIAFLAAISVAAALIPAAVLQRRLKFELGLRRVRDALWYFAISALAAGFSAILGSGGLPAAGVISRAELGHRAFVWTLTDVIGAWTLGALIVAWSDLAAARKALAERWREWAAILGLGVGVAVLIFYDQEQSPLWAPYWAFPFGVWSALRFGSRGATAFATALTVVATATTLASRGPFRGGGGEELLALQAFIVLLALTAVLLAASVEEGRRHGDARVRLESERERLESELRQAQKMEAIGRLAGGVAHDFNNLLTVILGYSDEILGRPSLDERSRDMLLEVRQAAERAASMTRQLLAFSRRAVSEPKEVKLNELVRESEKILRRLLGEDVEVSTALAPRLARIRVDPGQLDQVLLNLAVNARDAMPDGGSIRIETANVDLVEATAEAAGDLRPGRYVQMTVADTGIGMTTDVRERAFEPFFTTKEAGKGTGLGLSTVYGIVRQSGGHVRIESEPGSGTTVRILLPAYRESDSSETALKPRLAPASGTETILLVEDDAAVRELARRILDAAGFHVLVAADGDSAMRIASTHPTGIDLLVTDVVMPGMSGRKLAHEFAAARPGVGVLFLSGYADDAVANHGIVGAAVAFLQKPFSPHTLRKRVRELLDAKSDRAAGIAG